MIQGGDFRGLMKFDPLFQYGLRIVVFFLLEHVFRVWQQFSYVSISLPVAITAGIWTSILRPNLRSSLPVPAVMLCAVVAAVAYISFYQVGDREIFFVVTYPLTAMLMGLGLWSVLNRSLQGKREKGFYALLLALTAVALMHLGWTTIGNRSARHDTGALVFGETIMDHLPPGSILMVGLQPQQTDNSLYPLWYQKWGLGKKEDVTIIAANFLTKPWYRSQLAWEEIWFPHWQRLVRQGRVIEAPGLGMTFVSREAWEEAVLQFLQTNSRFPLYCLSMIEAVEQAFQVEMVAKAPVSPGSVEKDYMLFLPDGRLYRLNARQ
jgi:hypothetical protein